MKRKDVGGKHFFTPYFKHDCEECEYLETCVLPGLGIIADFYYCSKAGDTIIGRYGDDDSNYWSTNVTSLTLPEQRSSWSDEYERIYGGTCLHTVFWHTAQAILSYRRSEGLTPMNVERKEDETSNQRS